MLLKLSTRNHIYIIRYTFVSVSNGVCFHLLFVLRGLSQGSPFLFKIFILIYSTLQSILKYI